MSEPIIKSTAALEATEGWVVLNGPDGLVFTLSAAVARDLSAKLLSAAGEAEIQRSQRVI